MWHIRASYNFYRSPLRTLARAKKQKNRDDSSSRRLAVTDTHAHALAYKTLIVVTR